jgi:hypothetical protein
MKGRTSTAPKGERRQASLVYGKEGGSVREEAQLRVGLSSLALRAPKVPLRARIPGRYELFRPLFIGVKETFTISRSANPAIWKKPKGIWQGREPRPNRGRFRGRRMRGIV